MTRYHTCRRPRDLGTAWRDAVWPVLTGALAAVGLLGAVPLYGPLGVTLIVLFLWMLFAVTVFGVASESGIKIETAVTIGLWGSLSTVALLGLVEQFPVGGWIAALAIAITSPPVTDRLARPVRRAARALRRRSRSVPVKDQPAVDQAFAQIVAELKKDAG